jgi:GT2 family glycosyltransferase
MTALPRALTIAIVTHNSAALLPGCLDSLPAALGDIPYELVVVDNASSDGSVDVVRRHAPSASVVELEANLGYARGVNAAWTAAPSDALLVLNPDVRLTPDAGAALAAALTEPDIGIAVPRTVDGDGRIVHSLRRDPTVARALGEAILGGRRAGRIPRVGEVVRDPGAYLRSGTPDWASGAVMLVSRECREAVGPWDESYLMYSEELDFAWRARERGFRIRYVPDAVAVHLGGESGSSPELWRLLTFNRVVAFARRRGRLRAVAFWCAVVLNEALRAWRRGSAGEVHRAALAALMWPWRRPVLPGAGSVEPPGYVFFSAHDWWYHSHAHSDFQLARRIAGRRRVLFVNSIGLRMPRPGRTELPLRKVARKAASIARMVRRPDASAPALWVMTPVFIPAYSSATVRRVNAWLVAAQVSVVCRLLRINKPVAVVTIPTAWDVVRRSRAAVGWSQTVAYRVDRFASFAEANQGVIERLERALVKGAGRVAYAGRELMAAEANLADGRAFFLDHGVDVSLFHQRSANDEPPDLAAIPHPRVGYFGTLREYTVDLGLLERVARELPDAQVVIVGPVICDAGAIASLPNVHLLGARPYEEVPRYGSGFDVALMPWLPNEWIRFSNPIKLKEYLALGLPVVSTDFPEARRYAAHVRVAADADEFVALVKRTLVDGGVGRPQARREAVMADSWDRRATELMAAAELEAIRTEIR